MAIDGPCGSGKSTLARALGGHFHALVLHMDDFFLPPERKTPERLSEPGGNVDYERFLREVLEPIVREEPFTYRPYDCQTGQLADPISIEPGRLTIVEGVYSLHPSLRPAYDFKVFLDIDPQTQSARILQRNGPAMHGRFLNEWVPLENAYFDALSVKEACDLVIL